MKLKKAQLEKIWKQLDGALEAIELLQEHDFDTSGVDFTAIVDCKNRVEEVIEKKSRKEYTGMK